MPLIEGLTFAHNTLRGAGLRDRDMVTGQEVHPYLPEGFLVNEEKDEFGYLDRWHRSRSESFAPF